MPDMGWTLANGEGEAAIAGGSYVEPLVVLLHIAACTNPKVRFLGSAFPRRVQYAGSIGLGGDDNDETGTDRRDVAYLHPIQWEFDVFLVPPARLVGAFATHVLWRLPLGLDLYIDVWY